MEQPIPFEENETEESSNDINHPSNFSFRSQTFVAGGDNGNSRKPRNYGLLQENPKSGACLSNLVQSYIGKSEKEDKSGDTEEIRNNNDQTSNHLEESKAEENRNDNDNLFNPSEESKPEESRNNNDQTSNHLVESKAEENRNDNDNLFNPSEESKPEESKNDNDNPSDPSEERKTDGTVYHSLETQPVTTRSEGLSTADTTNPTEESKGEKGLSTADTTNPTEESKAEESKNNNDNPFDTSEERRTDETVYYSLETQPVTTRSEDMSTADTQNHTE